VHAEGAARRQVLPAQPHAAATAPRRVPVKTEKAEAARFARQIRRALTVAEFTSGMRETVLVNTARIVSATRKVELPKWFATTAPGQAEPAVRVARGPARQPEVAACLPAQPVGVRWWGGRGPWVVDSTVALK